MNMLYGLISPTSGEIRVKDQVVDFESIEVNGSSNMLNLPPPPLSLPSIQPLPGLVTVCP